MDQQNPYDFILNNTKPAKKPLLPGNGSSTKQRLLIVVAGTAVLLIVGIIFMNVLFGGSSGPTDQLLKLAQTQTELVRVADLGEQKAKGIEARNLAITAKLSLTTQLNETTERLAALGKTTKAKDLAIGQNAETDAALTAAEQASRFDEEFLKILKAELSEYQSSIQTTYGAASSATDKELLSTHFNDISTLLNKESET